MPLPPRGSKIVFQPLEHLQAIEYERISVSELGISEKHLGTSMKDADEVAKVRSFLIRVIGIEIFFLFLIDDSYYFLR